MDATSLTVLALACAPAVHPATALALTAVESSFNPHAIGVVGGVLARQPRSVAEALATARQLQKQGWNFSVGLAQINVHNLARLGLSIATVLDPCENLKAMQAILVECFDRAASSPVDTVNRSAPVGPPREDRPSGRATAAARTALNAPPAQTVLRGALSCYYSGHLTAGLTQGYVRRVAKAMPGAPPQPP